MARGNTMMGRVLRALKESSLEENEMEVQGAENGEEAVIQLTAEVVASAWQKIKGSFKGKGGYSVTVQGVHGRRNAAGSLRRDDGGGSDGRDLIGGETRSRG